MDKVLVLGHRPKGHHTHHFLVQGLLDLWVLGKVIQGPCQRVGCLGDRMGEEDEGRGQFLAERLAEPGGGRVSVSGYEKAALPPGWQEKEMRVPGDLYAK